MRTRKVAFLLLLLLFKSYPPPLPYAPPLGISNVIVENFVERLTSAVFGGVFAWVIFNVIGEKDIIPLANPAGFNHIINAGKSKPAFQPQTTSGAHEA